MIGIDERIARTQRLLRRLEEDQSYMHARLSPLGDEHRQSATNFAAKVRAEAAAELQRLITKRSVEHDISLPQPAD